MSCCEYTTIKKWTRIIQISACGLVVVIGILRFIFPSFYNPPVFYIVNSYLILLGSLAIISELEWESVLKYFNFLRYYFGKAFLTCL